MQNGLDVSIDQVSPADEHSMQLHRILQNPSFCIEVGLAVMKWKLRPRYIKPKAHDHLKSWTTKCWHIPRQENQGCENPSLHLLHFSSRPAEYKMSGTKLFTIKSCSHAISDIKEKRTPTILRFSKVMLPLFFGSSKANCSFRKNSSSAVNVFDNACKTMPKKKGF
jgi:hypothetical protein